MRLRFLWPLTLLALVAGGGAGYDTFVAHRMVRSPNTYPTWFAPKARLTLGFSPKLLTNFPAHFVEVGPALGAVCATGSSAGRLSAQGFLNQLGGTWQDAV